MSGNSSSDLLLACCVTLVISGLQFPYLCNRALPALCYPNAAVHTGLAQTIAACSMQPCWRHRETPGTLFWGSQSRRDWSWPWTAPGCSFVVGRQLRFLEQQNKVPETKWSLLQEQGTGSNTNNQNLEPFFENSISSLKDFLGGLHMEKSKLQGEPRSMEELVEDFKKRCAAPVPGGGEGGLHGGRGQMTGVWAPV